MSLLLKSHFRGCNNIHFYYPCVYHKGEMWRIRFSDWFSLFPTSGPGGEDQESRGTHRSGPGTGQAGVYSEDLSDPQLDFCSGLPGEAGVENWETPEGEETTSQNPTLENDRSIEGQSCCGSVSHTPPLTVVSSCCCVGGGARSVHRLQNGVERLAARTNPVLRQTAGS